MHLSLLAINPNDDPPSRNIDESFQVAQLMQATGTADAVAKMSARFAKGDGDLAKLVRDRQDAETRRARAEASLTGAFGKTAQERNPALEQRLRDEIAAAGKAIEATDAELARRFPEYHELARLQPVSVDEVRALLKPGEAMLAYALAGDAAYLWVVTRDGAQFLPLAAKAGDIGSVLAKVRGQMEFDPPAMPPGSASMCCTRCIGALRPGPAPSLGHHPPPDRARWRTAKPALRHAGRLAAACHRRRCRLPQGGLAGPPLRDVGAAGRRFDQGAASVRPGGNGEGAFRRFRRPAGR